MGLLKKSDIRFSISHVSDSIVQRIAVGRLYYGWYMVAVVFMLTLVRVGFNGHFFGIFLKPMSQEFEWTRSMTTGAVTAGTLIAAGLSFGVGRIVDKYGPRWLLVGACAILGLSYFALSHVGTLVAFYVIYAIGRSIAQSAIHNGILSTFVSKWFVRRRAQAIAIAIAGAYVGGMFFAPLVQHIITSYGWRFAWIFLGVLTWSIVLLPAGLLLRRSPEDMGMLPDGAQMSIRPSVPYTKSDILASRIVDGEETAWVAASQDEDTRVDEISLTLREAMRTATFWLLCLIQGVNSMSNTGINFHTVPRFTDVGISEAVAASTVSVFTMSQALAVFIVGLIASRIGAKVTLLGTLLTLAIGVVLISSADSGVSAYVAVFVYGGSVGGSTLLYNVVWADFFGRKHLGAIRGVSMAFQLVGNASGALIAAILYDINGDYNVAFTITLFGILVAFMMLLLTRNPKAL